MRNKSRRSPARLGGCRRTTCSWRQASDRSPEWHTGPSGGNVANATAMLAADFVARTNIDTLNVTAINTAERTFAVSPDASLISRLREQVQVPLVLQVNSSMTDQDLQRSVRAGIVKVHVGTALDMTFSNALRRSLRHSKIVDPRSYLAEVRTALTETGSVVLEASVAVARRGCRRAG